MRMGTLRRVLCVCVVVLGMSGLGASSAQATTWMVKGSNLAEGVLPTLVVRGHGVMLFIVSGNHIEILCTGMGIVSGHLLWGVLPYLLGSLRGVGCTIKINGVVATACEPEAEGVPGRINSNTLKGELIKHSTGEGVLLVKSTKEEVVGGVKQPVFGHVLTKVGCAAIPEDIPIVGPQAGVVDAGGNTALLTESKVHKAKEGPLTEIWALSKTTEHKASFGKGEVEAELESGELWSGLL